MSIVYASLCDGIGAAHVAWAPLGWRCAWTSEIEPFACAVVEHHWNLPNLGDMMKITEDRTDGYGDIDLVAGGTPCQSFSVAGLRGGLDDPRGNLALVFLGIAGMLRPRWIVFENVPGLLSSSGGWDFGAFLGAMAKLGYGFCWRILDACGFGIPQRRRRLFVVGYLGDWRPAAAVLLDKACLRGNPSPRRKARASVARCLTSSTGGPSAREQQLTFVDAEGRPLNALCMAHGQGHAEVAADRSPTLSCNHEAPILAHVVGPLCSHSPRHGHAMTTQQAVEAGHIVTHPLAFDCKRDGRGADGVAPTLRAMNHDGSHANAGGQVAVAYPLDLRNAGRDADKCDAANRQGCGVGADGGPAPACTAGPVAGVAYAFQPRIGRSGRGQPSEIVPALGGASAGAGATSDSRPCVAVSLKLDNGSAQPIGGVEVTPTIRQGPGPTARPTSACTRATPSVA